MRWNDLLLENCVDSISNITWIVDIKVINRMFMDTNIINEPSYGEFIYMHSEYIYIYILTK